MSTMFKILLLVVVLPLIICACIEWFNVYTNTYKLQPLIRIGVDQAAKMFSEESFCLGDATPQSLFPDLRATVRGDSDSVIAGSFSVKNDIFNNKQTPSEIYNYLMDESTTSMKDFAYNTRGEVVNVDQQPVYFNETPAGVFQNLGLIVDDMSVIGEVYRESLATSMNLGIPYLDEKTVTAMSKWNLAQILNVDGKGSAIVNANTELGLKTTLKNLHRDNIGYYVMWNGFRVYIDKLVLDVRYEILDMTSVPDQEEFTEITGMDANTLFGSGAIVSGGNEKNVILTFIDYTVPYQYEGLTPWRRVFSWVYAGSFGAVSSTNNGNLENSSWNDIEERRYTTGNKATGISGFLADMNGEAPVASESTGINTSGLSYLNTYDEATFRNRGYLLEGTVIHYIIR